MNYMQQQSS